MYISKLLKRWKYLGLETAEVASRVSETCSHAYIYIYIFHNPPEANVSGLELTARHFGIDLGNSQGILYCELENGGYYTAYNNYTFPTEPRYSFSSCYHIMLMTSVKAIMREKTHTIQYAVSRNVHKNSQQLVQHPFDCNLLSGPFKLHSFYSSSISITQNVLGDNNAFTTLFLSNRVNNT